MFLEITDKTYPDFILFRSGKEILRLSGAISRTELDKALNELICSRI